MSAESQLFSQKRQEAKHNETFDRDEEYAMAKRAAVEATTIGRETLETALRQGEQLQNAENLAGETEYKLDRATRLLRGMTWAGWWANKFSSDVEPPEFKMRDSSAVEGSDSLPPKVYDNVPEMCISAAQAVQNYHVNLQVLESCETLEQKDTCTGICNNMYQKARQEVIRLQQSQDARNDTLVLNFSAQLGRDLKVLYERYKIADDTTNGDRSVAASSSSNATAALFAGKCEGPKMVSPTHQLEHQQEDHLDFMSKHLNELGSLASNLHTSLAMQADTLASLEEKSDVMLYKSKMVTRRTDTVIQKKSWNKAKKEFLYEASIQHLPSGKYLAVSTSSSGLQLSDKLNETCIFRIWQRQTAAKVFGLQSKYSHRWVGQNFLGHLVCSAYSFDRREEWDTDHEKWSRTPLICASAGWGNGAYLLVQKENDQLILGSGGLNDKKIADMWCIESHGPSPARPSP